MNLLESLQYQPVELGFGTSGLRGLVKDMTDLECYINVAGFLLFLKQYDSLKQGKKIYIAGDLRDSTPHIMQVVSAACEAYGLVPVNCGKVPTPTAAYYALYDDASCIVVTGSHIPNDRNGIKFYKRSGEVLKEDEAAIQAAVASIRHELYEQSLGQSLFEADGALKKLPALPDVVFAVEKDYLERYTQFFSADCLSGKDIVVYQHSAVGRDLLVELLRDLGATPIPVERSDVFVPIDTENVTKQDQELFLKLAQKYPQAFATISTDGDSDRPFVIDETGFFHRGDVLGCVVADFLGAKFAAIPISSNDAVDSYCEQKGITLAHTKIGSPYVIAAMDKAPEQAKPAVSWEVNGGFLTGDDIRMGNKVLKPLPTRDAVLPIICALLTAVQKNQTVSELFAGLPHRYTAGSLIDNVPPEKISKFKEECKNEETIKQTMQRAFAGTPLGNIVNINLTDGLRLRFDSGDIMHLRPSGNAPQFRVYTNAASQNKADDLAEAAVSPEGYIEKLLRVL